MFHFRSAWIRLAAFVLLLGVCFSCSDSEQKLEPGGGTQGRTATVMGDGLCRTVMLESDGKTPGEVITANIAPGDPVVGYITRNIEILSWSSFASTTSASGRVEFTATEGTGRFDFTAYPDRTVRVTSAIGTTPAPSTQLHVTAMSLRWNVSDTSPVNQPSIAIRVRLSPHADGGTNRCLNYICDPAVGPEVCSPVAAGESCSDGNACNGIERCDGQGACAPGTNLAAGTSCADGNVCNGAETCNGAGACAAGPALTAAEIDDHNPCTGTLPNGPDSCDPARGIVHDFIPGCQSFGNPSVQPDRTVTTNFGESIAFLYSGASPIQTGVAGGTILPARASVVRGRVLSSPSFASTTRNPVSGAVVKVLGHPEYGQTLTRSDGYYDLVVNGGGPVVVDVAAAGMLAMQRTLRTEPREFSIAQDIVLTAPFTSPETFTNGSAAAQVVHGQITPANEDLDPSRQAVIYFPPDTHVDNFVPPGGPLQVQITEYTRGPNGEDRMPGELPPTSGYTYAFEATLPAAAAAGVTDVEFDKKVSVYVDNFNHIPIGEVVPLGYYDRSKGAWLGQESGKVIKVVAAGVDWTGDGVADSPASAPELGLTTTEVQTIQAQYPVGRELWRLRLGHFSPWDANYGFGAPADSIAAAEVASSTKEVPPGQCTKPGSVIGCEGMTLGEHIGISGTPFTLTYRSDRTSGFGTEISYAITDGRDLPESLMGIHAWISIAGRTFRYEYSRTTEKNARRSFFWDGLDAYGRPVVGTTKATIRVGYQYQPVTLQTGGGFGAAGNAAMALDVQTIRFQRVLIRWSTSFQTVSRFDAQPFGFGGWMLDAHQAFDPESNMLYSGTGETRPVSGAVGNLVVERFAGGGSATFPGHGDNGSALNAYFGTITDLAQGPDGSIYVAQDGGSPTGRIRRIAPNGIVTTIAGNPAVAGYPTPKSNGGLAATAQIQPGQIAVGRDGTVFFSEMNTHQIWKVEPGANPKIWHVAGNGNNPPNFPQCSPPNLASCGDGGLATAADLRTPGSIAVAADGTLFISDVGHARVRRVGPEGLISTYADWTVPNAAGPAAGPSLSLRDDGVLFVRRQADVVTRIEPSGTAMSNVANSMQADWCGHVHGFGGDFVAREDDSWLVYCRTKLVVRAPSGQLGRVAGPEPYNTPGNTGNGEAALRALFEGASLVDGQRGEVFVGETNGVIRRLRDPRGIEVTGGAVVPSTGGSVGYEFDVDGKHVRTRATQTGASILSFGYDPTTHQLTSITDAFGQQTTISRPSATEVRILSPHQELTKLTLDGNGFLQSVDRAGEITEVTHDAKGLLTDFVDPRGLAHHFEYSSSGRLDRDVNAVPGSPGTRLLRTETPSANTVDVTSPEGRLTTYTRIKTGAFGDAAVSERRVVSNGGLETTTEFSRDGAHAQTYPDGTRVATSSMAADPRWGPSVSYPTSSTVTTGGSTVTTTEARTATLSIAGDPFSATAQTITRTRTGSGLTATTTATFAAGSPSTWTMTSAENANRRVRTKVDALGRVTEIASLGSDPVAVLPVQITYDAKGRVSLVKQGTREYGTSYDAVTGWVTSTSDPAGLGVSYTQRDARGRPLNVVLPGGHDLGFTYDASGNVASITPPEKPAHVFIPNARDDLGTYAPPALGFPNKDTTYTYDMDGLLRDKNQPGTPSSFGYDSRGRLIFASNDQNATTIAYDTVGRLSRVQSSANGGVLIANTYNQALLTKQSTTFGGTTHDVNWGYDGFLRPSSRNIDGANSIAFTYDKDDLPLTVGALTLSRGGDTGILKATSLGSLTDSFGYNTYGELTSYSTATLGGTAYSTTYTRDAAGRVGTKTEVLTASGTTTTTTSTYTYDAEGRLGFVHEVRQCTGAAPCGPTTRDTPYTYDANGNRSQGTPAAVYDDQDRLVSQGGRTYTYGPNGELSSVALNGATEVTYQYDSNGSLRQANRTGQPAIQYTIDGLGRRVRKSTGAGPTPVQGFLYSGSRIIAELDGAGNIVSHFIYATSGHSPDYMIKGGVNYRLVKDQLGSIRLVINASSGAVAQRLDYDEWGVTTEVSGAGFQPFGFAGGLYDRDTKLVRFGARDYDPSLGRWTTKDLSRFGGGLNLFGYASGDPINYIDVNGHWVLPVIAVVAIVVFYGYIFASDDAATQRAAHPEAADSPAAGIMLSAGVVAPVALLGAVGELGVPAQAAAACGGGAAAGADRGNTLKDAVGSQDAANRVNAALKGRIPVESLTPDERGAAAAFYRGIATRTVGSKAAEAAQFNRERAAFLEGETDVVPGYIQDSIKRNQDQ